MSHQQREVWKRRTHAISPHEIRVVVESIPGLMRNENVWSLLRLYEFIANELLKRLPKQKGSQVIFDRLIIRPLYTKDGLASVSGLFWARGHGLGCDGYRGHYVIAMHVQTALKVGDVGIKTFLHEMAHLYHHWETRESGHGARWKHWDAELQSQYTSICQRSNVASTMARLKHCARQTVKLPVKSH